MQSSSSQSAEPVALATLWCDRLVRAEAARHDLTIREAAHTTARRLRTSPRLLIRLLYEKPKDVPARVFETLRDAIERELIRQIEALTNDLEAARNGRGRLGPVEVAEIEADIAGLRARIRGAVVDA